MEAETHLIVRGRKDNRPRRVEHIPFDVKIRKTQVDPGYFKMLYHGDNGISVRVISESRIEHKVMKPTGPLS